MEAKGAVRPESQPTTCHASASGPGINQELARVLVERYCARLRGLVRVIAGDRVRRIKGGTDDILQEIWKSFLSNLAKGETPEADADLWTLLACFARRKSLNAVRYAYGEGRDRFLTGQFESLAETLRDDPDPSLDEATDVTDETEHVVRRLVESLDEAEKERVQTIVGMRLEGYTHEEIATQVGCSAKTVQRELEDFRRALKERLEAAP